MERSPIDIAKKVSKFELRDMITALTHQVGHLERSQVELMQALREDPNDADFKAAYLENISAISKRKSTIREFKAHLKDIDIAYYLEHYKEVDEISPATVIAPASTRVTDSAESIQADTSTLSDQSGVYL